MDTFLSLNTEALGRLDSGEAIRQFSHLLWAQARRKNVPITKIRFSLREDVPDGGIDAEIDADAFQGSDDALVRGNTSYQVKTGTSTKPCQQAWVRKELFGKRKRVEKANLGSAVRNCLDSGGRYVLVCFGNSLNPNQCRESQQLFKGFFAQCGYPDAAVEVWGQETLVGLFSVFPSLCSDIKGLRNIGGFQSHTSWAMNDDMTPAIVYGDPQNRCIDEIRDFLRGKDVRYVRVIGEPGVGKTRLVLEAIRAEDLAPCVLYIPHAEDFQRSALFNAILHPDADYYVILVLDECPVRDSAEIWNVLKNRPQNCRIVAIDHDPSESHDVAMREVLCPGLGKEQVTAILRSYVSCELECSRWADECGESPRVAHAVGENLKANPGDILRSPATVPIWDRFVAGNRSVDTPEVQRRLLVLRHLSLFERFGFEKPVQDESRLIAGLAQEVDPALTWKQFESVVALLRKRRILQGKRTLFIAPRLLQVRLWRDFWDNYGRGLHLTELFARLPGGLRSWFIRMLPYTHTSETATAAVREFLGPSGLFSAMGGRQAGDALSYVSHLAKAVPESTLECLERVFAQTGSKDLLFAGGSRVEIVWALEGLAVWRHLFFRSASLLLRLAAAEDAVNGSTGTAFAELFSLACGAGAPTEAEPPLRLPLLKAALTSRDPKERALGLKACRTALSTYGPGRGIGREHQGLRPTARLWMPETWKELFDAYAAVWNMLVEATRPWSTAERCEANRILMGSAPGLLFRGVLDDMVLATLDALADDEATDLRELVDLTVTCRRVWRQHVSESARTRLSAIDAKITGTTFSSRARRVLMLFSPHERFDEANGFDGLPGRIGELAQEAVEHPEKFASVAGDLIQGASFGIYLFGRELSVRDKSRMFLRQILDCQRAAQAGATTHLLSGYLSHLYETERTEWERAVRGLFADPSLKAVAPHLVWRSGLTKTVFEDMLQAYDKGELDFSHFHMLTVTCPRQELDEEHVLGLLARWLALPGDKSPEFPLQLLSWFYGSADGSCRLPEQQVLDVLADGALYGAQRFVGFFWARVVDWFLQQYPAHALDVFRIIVEQVFKSASVLFGSDQDVQAVAEKIIKDNGQACWAIISPRLEDEGNPGYHAVWHWLSVAPIGIGSESGLISCSPDKVVLDWITEAPDTRAMSLARLAPKSLGPSGKGSLTRELLVRYGERADVRASLSWRFSSDGWSGRASDHYRRRRDDARHWLDHEEHPNVRRFLEDRIRFLTAEIEGSEIDEERRL